MFTDNHIDIKKIINNLHNSLLFSHLSNKLSVINKGSLSKKLNLFTLNYSTHHIDFNQVYFFKNFFKCSVTLSILSKKIDLSIFSKSSINDYGSGQGNFTLAWLNIINNYAEVKLLDQSNQQLTLARSNLAPFNRQKFQFIHVKVPDLQSNKYSVNIFSYFLCEQKHNFIKENIYKFGIASIIIDYEYIIAQLTDSLILLQKNFYRISYIQFDKKVYSRKIQKSINDHHLKVTALYIELNSIYMVREYFNSWQTYDLKKLRRVFLSDAQYKRSSKKTLVGIKSIESYWIRNRKRQENLTVQWSIIYAKNNHVKVNFQATFFDQNMQHHNTISGVINFKFIDSKISLLYETYQKKVSF